MHDCQSNCRAGPALERGRPIILCALRRRIPRLKEIARFEIEMRERRTGANIADVPRALCSQHGHISLATTALNVSPRCYTWLIDMLLDARPLMRVSSARSRLLCSSVYMSEGASLSSPLHAMPSSSAYVLSQQPSRNLTKSTCSTESNGMRTINMTATSSIDNDDRSRSSKTPPKSNKGGCTGSIWFTRARCGGGGSTCGGGVGGGLYSPHMQARPMPLASGPKSKVGGGMQRTTLANAVRWAIRRPTYLFARVYECMSAKRI